MRWRPAILTVSCRRNEQRACVSLKWFGGGGRRASALRRLILCENFEIFGV